MSSLQNVNYGSSKESLVSCFPDEIDSTMGTELSTVMENKPREWIWTICRSQIRRALSDGKHEVSQVSNILQLAVRSPITAKGLQEPLERSLVLLYVTCVTDVLQLLICQWQKAIKTPAFQGWLCKRDGQEIARQWVRKANLSWRADVLRSN